MSDRDRSVATLVCVGAAMAGLTVAGAAQQAARRGQAPRTAQSPPPPINWPAPPLPDGPIALETAEERTGQLQRIVFNDKWEEIRREALLREFHQRIRDVRQGPDGFLYVLTEENDAALLRFEPGPAPAK